MSNKTLKRLIQENQKRNNIRPWRVKVQGEETPPKKRLNKNNNLISCITWATGEDSVDKPEFKLYYGVTPVEVIGFNPTKKQLEEIYNRPQEREPVYVGKRQFGKQEVKYADCVFYLRTIKAVCGIEKILRLRLQILNLGHSNKEQTKLQVVDKYNRTCWLTKDEYMARAVPIYRNGPAKIDAKSYIPLYRGALDVNAFLRAYLGIADIMVFDPTTGGQMVNPTPEKAVGILEHPELFFDGNFKELTDILASVKKHTDETKTTQKLKVMIGISTNAENRQFMEVFPLAFAKYRDRPQKATGLYRVFSWALKDIEGNNRVQNTEWYAGDLKEYTNTPTEFSKPAQKDSPESLFPTAPALPENDYAEALGSVMSAASSMPPLADDDDLFKEPPAFPFPTV